jgi:hypothetical protein
MLEPLKHLSDTELRELRPVELFFQRITLFFCYIPIHIHTQAAKSLVMGSGVMARFGIMARVEFIAVNFAIAICICDQKFSIGIKSISAIPLAQACNKYQTPQ